MNEMTFDQLFFYLDYGAELNNPDHKAGISDGPDLDKFKKTYEGKPNYHKK